MNKRTTKGVQLALLIMLIATLAMAFAVPAFADTTSDTAIGVADDELLGSKALAAAITIGIAALGGAIGMALAIGKAMDGIARQPEADGKIRTTLMLGLVFIETAIIYALLVVILIIFVL